MSEIREVNLNSASTPEQAAQMFLGTVSVGLAALFAKAVDEALGKTLTSTKSISSIAGWQDLIGGAHMDLQWERNYDGSPKTLVAFAPYEQIEHLRTVKTIGVTIGVSITGTF